MALSPYSTYIASPSQTSIDDTGCDSRVPFMDEKHTLLVKRRWGLHRKITVGIAGVVLLAILGWLAYTLVGVFVGLQMARGLHNEFGDCGGSIAEAQAKGWLPN